MVYFIAFARLVDSFLWDFCGCFWSFARNLRAVSGGKLCTTGTSDIELSTVGKRAKIDFQRYQARHLAWVWRRNSKKKVDENRTFFEVWNLVFVRKKNSIEGNRGTFFMNRVYFDVDFLMQPSRFAYATVFSNSIGQTAGKASIKILGAPHSRRCFFKNVCFSVQNPVEMGLIVSKSMLKSARLIFCIVIRRKLPGYFYADSCCQNMQNHPVKLLQTVPFSIS